MKISKTLRDATSTVRPTPSRSSSFTQSSAAASTRSSLFSRTSSFSADEECHLTFMSAAELVDNGHTPYRSKADGRLYSREELTHWLTCQLIYQGPQALVAPVTAAPMRKDALALGVFAQASAQNVSSAAMPAQPQAKSKTSRPPKLAAALQNKLQSFVQTFEAGSGFAKAAPQTQPTLASIKQATLHKAAQARDAIKHPHQTVQQARSSASEAWLDFRIRKQQSGKLFG